MTSTDVDLAELTVRLAADITGRVVTPDDPDWAAATQAWNLAVRQTPALVVQPADADDIVAAVRFARAAGLRIAPQGTGHNAAALGDLTGCVLLRTDALKEVTVDPQTRTVRVGAGVIWQDVTTALHPHGLTALAGSAFDVGVVGYTTGGGYSWLARRHGLAANLVTAVELVTGTGEFLRVDRDHHPEIFWAVRGGGANVGVVCALEFEVFPQEQIYAGFLLFPIDRAAEVVEAWRLWTDDLDEAATTCLGLLRFPDLPMLPDFLAGRSFVGIDGAIDLPGERAEALLAPLRDLGPEIDTWEVMPTSALATVHMDPPGPVPGVVDGMSLSEFTADTAATLLEVAGPAADTDLLFVDLRHLGGAAGRPAPDGGAVSALPGRVLVELGGISLNAEAGAAIHQEVERIKHALSPWRGDREYVNFSERDEPPTRYWAPATLERLRAVADQVNPDRTVRANHQIG